MEDSYIKSYSGNVLGVQIIRLALIQFVASGGTSLLAYPTMVPTPTSLSVLTPATDVNSSGAEEPAAMKVAPATSSLKFSLSEMASRLGTKKSSQIMAIALGRADRD